MMRKMPLFILSVLIAGCSHTHERGNADDGREFGVQRDRSEDRFPRLTIQSVEKLSPEAAKAILVARVHIEATFQPQDWNTELRLEISPLKDGWEVRGLQFIQRDGIFHLVSNMIFVRMDRNWRVYDHKEAA